MGEIDLALRHIAQQFPEELARAQMGRDSKFTVTGWFETQFAERERRLDRTLEILYQGQPRLLHIEFQSVMEADVPYRIFEYHNLLAMALRDLSQKTGQPPPPIDSTVVLLTGREELWPTKGIYQTSWPEGDFCGVQYRLDPVYQLTIEQLKARGNLLWLIFAPLTRDATIDKLIALTQEMQQRAQTQREFGDLAAAMLVMADADGRERKLREPLAKKIPKEIVMQSWVYQQGQAWGRANDIIKVLTLRGLPVSEELQEKIKASDDLLTLDLWLERAVTAATIDEFLTGKKTKPTKKSHK